MCTANIPTGYLHGEDLSQAFASADALVFPSLTDTFGNAVLEARASGLPAIVSDRGGPREVVRASDSGLIVDATGPECLAEAMTGMATDKEAYQDYCGRAMITEPCLKCIRARKTGGKCETRCGTYVARNITRQSVKLRISQFSRRSG